MLARPQDRPREDPRAPAPLQPSSLGRYTIYGQIGAGGMATVQYAHFVGPGGFSRPVAIKRLHPHFASDPSFVSSFLDEARISARIAHANVVATLDVIDQPDEISVVMEYVHGESLAGLFGLAQARGRLLPPRIATSMLVGVLHGLQAAHETCGERGDPLGIVHRDVSPENILVGSDGVARLLDFGIAKAKGRSRTTPTGELKGKLGYMAPEQYRGEDIDRRVDVYGASVVLWEALTGRVLFDGANDAAVVNAVMNGVVRAPSELAPGLPPALDRLVLRGLSRNRDDRFESAREMALALERDTGVATQSEVSDWLEGLAGPLLQERAAALGQLRLRAHGHTTREASELGTRRLAVELSASMGDSRAPGRASTPTRALPLEIEPALTGRNSQSGLRPRKSARTGRWALLALACLGGGIWLTSALTPASGPATSPPEPAAGDRAAPREAAPARAEAPGPAQHAGPDALDPTPAREERAPRASEKSSARRVPERARRDGGKGSAKPHPKSAPKSADCAQPYVIDALGIRRWKRECL